ncbi:MAG: hypothetical protein ACUVQW_02210 [Candidatus Bathycorpusculaceae bacterium]
MNMNKKAISTLTLIILILCSTIFGAIISYLWVMSNYYMEPENMVDLVIIGVDFPVNHADYFYVTVMNPTHSSSSTNITDIYFTVEGNDTKYNVGGTFPELPIPIDRGTTKTIKCNRNWGDFAGNTITVHVLAINASGASYSYKTEFVKLYVETFFNATESVEYFNLTVRNDAQSKINLTLTKVFLLGEEITKTSKQLPMVVPINESVELQCFYNWEGFVKFTITLETEEGYIFKAKKEDVASIANLIITNVAFNETNSTEISITILNQPESKTLVDISNVAITYEEGVNSTVFDPPIRVNLNETVTLNCVWDWTDYRDKNLTINVYTKQGFKAGPKTVKTPSPVVLKITELGFNLTDTGNFSVTVQNLPCSKYTNITRFTVSNENFTEEFNIAPYPLNVTESQTFNFTFNWTAYEGLNVTVTVYTDEGFNANHTITLPKVMLTANFDRNKSTKYFSIAIQNNAHMALNITGISVNETTIDANLTYPALPVTIENGETILIVCPFDWEDFSGEVKTITVATANGFDITTTVTIP